MPVNFNMLSGMQIPQATVQMPQPMQAPPQPQSDASSIGGVLKGAAGILSSFKQGNPVATANNAINQQMQNTPAPVLANSILNPSATNLPAQQASPQIKNPQQQLQNKIQPTAQNLQVNPQTAATLNGIYQNESSGEKNPYTSVGKPTKNGNVALGKYQIMDFNVSSWTKEATGKALTKEQFLADPKAQEITAAYKVNSLLNQGYSPQDAASIWFSGKPLDHADMYAKDSYGTSVKQYVDKFSENLSNPKPITTVHEAMNTPPQNINGGTPIPPEMEKTPAFSSTMQKYAQLRQQGLTKSPIVTTVDYTQDAKNPRLSVINAETGKVLMQTEVAQGSGKGFSNVPNSHTSSLGTFMTESTYDGKHGMSLKIKGLDKGVNDNVEARDIVVHGADYIGNGKTGHSFGCFAVPTKDAPKLINLIKGGTMIYAYGQQPGQNGQQGGQQRPIQAPAQQAPQQSSPQNVFNSPPPAVSALVNYGIPSPATKGQIQPGQNGNVPNPQLQILPSLMNSLSSRRM